MANKRPSAGGPTRDAPLHDTTMGDTNVSPPTWLRSATIEAPVIIASEQLERRVSLAPPGPEGVDDLGFLGAGGMGEVRGVIDRRLMRVMALKTLTAEASGSRDARLRFVEEAQITGQLDHPNIVPVHALGLEQDGTLYFTMKLVRGTTLSDMLADLGERRLDSGNLERLVAIVVKVCDAVAFAHSRGVIHRDLKASNLMVGTHGQVYVMDWGLALLRRGPRLVSDEGIMIGTPGYMAPEQARQRVDEMDERTDVYGLGGILYRILSQRLPHHGASDEAIIDHTLHGQVADPRELCSEPLPPELCRIALKALARSPGERYPSVERLRADLIQFQRGGGWLATKTFAAGSLLMAEGDAAEEAYVVTDGECEAFKTADGKRTFLRRMGPGEVIGEAALLTDQRRSASVRALDDVTVKVITRDALQRELERNDWLGAFVRVLASRFRELDERVSRLRVSGRARPGPRG